MIFLRRVVGDSMMPGLRDGQYVWAYITRNFSVGDVVVAFVNGREVVKRIKKMEKGKVYLRGDNDSSSTDSRVYGWIGDQYIEGVVFWPRPTKHKQAK